MEKLIKQRVKRGIKWLNKNQKGWYKKVELRKFDINNGNVCICGQVFEDMMNGYIHGYDYFVKKYSRSFATALGFNAPLYTILRMNIKVSDEYFDILGREWIKEIKKLKKC